MNSVTSGPMLRQVQLTPLPAARQTAAHTAPWLALVAVVGITLSPPGLTHDEPAEDADKGPWSGLVALGYTKVSGNTETASFRFNTEVNYDAERWHHQVLGRALLDSSDNQTTGENETTAESYKASGESKFDLTERTYLFGLVEYNKDRFSSYERQIFEIVGIGRRFIDTEKHLLNAQIGVGAGQSKLTDGTDENEFSTRGSADYTWKISDTASFQQRLSVTYASSNTYTESVTELRAAVIGSLNMVLSYVWKNNSDVLPGTEKTDTQTSISLEYAF